MAATAAASALLCLRATASGPPPDIARGLTAGIGAQGRILWVDGTANLTRSVHGQTADYTTTEAGVRLIVDHCRAAHVNTIVVDVKPLGGEVLYHSTVAPRLADWKGHPVPDFDVLEAFVRLGHAAGIRVEADINVLSEGHKYFSTGPAYSHRDWQSVVYTVDRGLDAPDGSRLALHAPNEPSAATLAQVYPDDRSLLNGEPMSGMIGLEAVESQNGEQVRAPSTPFGTQENVVLDAHDRVVGIVDSALLADDPLSAPEGGHLIAARSRADRAWVQDHLHSGAVNRFDLQTRFVAVADAPSEKIACFVNALDPGARRHELDIVREIATRYDVDGIVLDRCRYADLYNDFSDRSRAAFEQYIGRSVSQWPADIFTFPREPGDPLVTGPLYQKWLEFRATVIRDLVGEIAQVARAARPSISLGTYVGSWYPSYFEVGVNWGGPDTSLRYPWFTHDYPRTGYAGFFDWISTGCYYSSVTSADARRTGTSPHATVEYAAGLSRRAIAEQALLYPGIYLPDYAGRPEAFRAAIETCEHEGEGVMLFDLSYLDAYGWWPILDTTWPGGATAPHALPHLLSTVRGAADMAH